jgi:hypothetical protein
MFSLAQGDKVLDAAGSLNDPAAKERLERIVTGYVKIARAIASS